jgi:hypothetical protein
MLKRLWHTTPRELVMRGAERMRVVSEMARVSVATPGWRVRQLRLTSLTPDIVRARRALAARDWLTAEQALRSHFSTRPARFLIDPAARRRLVETITRRLPSSPVHAARRAAPLLEHRYDLLGYTGLSFATETTAVDWHTDPVHQRRAPLVFWSRVPYLDPSCGDHKIIWELNRHQHWLALGRAAWLTGEDRCAAACVDDLESWLDANPPLRGINWSSMLEIAFRSISWTWALHFCVACHIDTSRPWLTRMLAGLDRQLDHIARHLSTYFSPNTHLLGEGLALYVAGRVLPELASARRWERIGQAILTREASAQVHPDGGHAELSPHYHRYALDFYLLALAIARRTGDDHAARFEEVATRLAVFCRAMASDRGRLPTIGDDDGGRLFPILPREPSDARDTLWVAATLLQRPDLAIGDIPEEVFWMLGDEPGMRASGPGRAPSRLFRDTGYAVLRTSREQGIFDVGPHGFLNGGHAHADALALVLSIEGRPLLIDPGTATYTMAPARRDWFRATAMHNTAVIDGRPQSVPSGPFHWASRANARPLVWRACAPGTPGFIEAEHDGYRPLVHRRGILYLSDGLWLVADHVLGGGTHEIVLHWHIDPAWSSAGGGHFSHADGLHAAFASTAGTPEHFNGDADGLGWYAPVYGRVLPAPTLRMTSAGAAPVSVVTAILSPDRPAVLDLSTPGLEVEGPDGWHRAAAAITTGTRTWVAVFATPAAATAPPGDHGPGGVGGPGRAACRIRCTDGELTTDARAAVLRLSPAGEADALALIDGGLAEWTGRMGFRVTFPQTADCVYLEGSALRA